MLELIWFDPGSTTGVVFLKVDPAYLDGDGYDTSWEALGKAVHEAHYEQYGRNPRVWNGRARKPEVGANPFSGDYADEIEIADRAQSLLDDHPKAAWGYEDFILKSANKSRDFLAPVRLFAMMSALEQVTGAGRTPFVQGTSIKSTVDDERLTRAGLYRPGMIHANDAARHAAHFLRRTRSDSKLARLAWPHR